MTTTPTATPALPPPSVKNEAHGIAVPLQLSVHASGSVSLQELLPPPPLPFSSSEAQAAALVAEEKLDQAVAHRKKGCCSRCGPDGVCVSEERSKGSEDVGEGDRERGEGVVPSGRSPVSLQELLPPPPLPFSSPEAQAAARRRGEEKLDQAVAHRKKGKSRAAAPAAGLMGCASSRTFEGLGGGWRRRS